MAGETLKVAAAARRVSLWGGVTFVTGETRRRVRSKLRKYKEKVAIAANGEPARKMQIGGAKWEESAQSLAQIHAFF